MRKILFCLLLCSGSCPSAVAAPAFVHYTTGFICADQLQVPFTVNAGDTVVVAVRLSSTGTSTITSSDATWTRDVHEEYNVGLALDIHHAWFAAAGNYTLTIDAAGNGGRAIRAIILEYSGIASSSAAVATSSAHGTSGTINAGSVTTPVDNCILFAAAATDTDLQGWSAGSGFTVRNNCNAELEPDQKLCIEDRGPVVAGTYHNGFTIVPDSWVAGIVAYTPAGSITNPPAPPATLTVNVVNGGTVTGGAFTSKPYHDIQFSSDLVHWQTILKNTFGPPDSKANLSITTDAPRGFIRIVGHDSISP